MSEKQEEPTQKQVLSREWNQSHNKLFLTFFLFVFLWILGLSNAVSAATYIGKATRTVIVEALDMSDQTVTVTADLTYNGQAQEATVTVKGKMAGSDYTLVKDTDYTLTFSNNINAGTNTASVTIKGINRFQGEVTKNYSIKPKSITATWSNTSFYYDGATHTPTAVVEDTGVTVGGVKETVTLSVSGGAIEIGTHQATATISNVPNGNKQIGNYTLSNPTQNFTISARSISDGGVTVTIDPTEYTYNGGAHTPTVSVTYGSITYTSGTDYEVTYSDNINAGTNTAKVKVTGKGRLTGSVEKTFTIKPKSITATWSNTSFTYDGATHTPSAVITDTGVTVGGVKETVTLGVSGGSADIGIHQATATISDVPNGNRKTGNYTLSNPTQNFTISARSISDGGVTVTIDPTEYTYNGGAHTPTVSVTYNSVTFTSGTDYDVAYSNNINAGENTAKVTVTGKGRLTGSVEKTFTIKPKSITVTWSNTSFTYDGANHIPTAVIEDTGVTVGGVKETVTLTVSGAQSTVGTHQATAAISDVPNGNKKTGNYTLSNPTQNFTISARSISDGGVTVAIAPTEYTYDGTAHTPNVSVSYGDITFTSGTDYEVAYSNNINAGTNTAKVKVTGKGRLSDSVEKTFTIKPKELLVKWDNLTFTYDGTTKTPTATTTGVTVGTVTEQVKLTVSGGKIEPGTYPATASIQSVTGGQGKVENYTLSNPTENFTISARGITETTITLKPEEYTYNGKECNPEVTITYQGVTLEKGKDYTVIYTNNIDAGTATATIVGSNRLTGTTQRTYTILPKHVSVTWGTTVFTYDGTEKLPSGSVDTEVENETIQLTITGGQTEPSATPYTATASIGRVVGGRARVENYVLENTTTEFTINRRSIADFTITLKPTEYDYDGTAHQPEVTVKWGEQVLEKDKDYTVEYRDNVNAGQGKAIITGIGRFSGQVTKEFTIHPLPIRSVGLEQETYTYTGENIEPLPIVYGSDGNLLKKDVDYTVTYENNKLTGTATLTVTGKGNYYGEKSVNFTIVGASLSNAYVRLKGLPYVYDGTPKCPKAVVVVNGRTLIEGIDYYLDYENNIEAGTNTAIAIITGMGGYSGVYREPFSILKANRQAKIAPGKAVILGDVGSIPYSYKGEETTVTLTIDDPRIFRAVNKVYGQKDTIDIAESLMVGVSTLTLHLAESKNYYAADLHAQVTVFANEEEAYPLYGTVIINDDDDYTNSPRTMLTLSVDFGDYMYISESNQTPDINDPNWQEFSTKMPHIFSSVLGTKTIYAWFKDKEGIMTPMAMDDIELIGGNINPETNEPMIPHDYILLDQTPIDRTAPSIEIAEYDNQTADVDVVFQQEDVLVNGVRSGVDRTTIEYGYRPVEGTTVGNYTWQKSPRINNLTYQDYAFVTRAYDRAGNGVTVSEEFITRVEMKYETKITIVDSNRQYNGNTQEIEEATVELIHDKEVTGKITYTYYVDKECTVKTTGARDGSLSEGGAPSQPGVYYVIARLTGDQWYYDAESEVAELRIGWFLSKTEDDNVFSYVERTSPTSDEFNLHVMGQGNMKDLKSLLVPGKDEQYLYWSKYKERIVQLKLEDLNDNSLTNIGANIFSNLTRIPDISIPNTVVQIGAYAFEGCSGVVNTITIPMSVTKIDANPFVGVGNTTFATAEEQRYFKAVNGVLMNQDQSELVAYPMKKVEQRYEIPSTVKEIRESAFSRASVLTNVVIPNGVQTIEPKAFYQCSALTKVEVEDLMDENDTVVDLNQIGSEAFSELPTGSIVYTFSEYVARNFVAGQTHTKEKTEIYYPPVITLHPIDMNGIVGVQVKYIVEAKAGYPEPMTYQWYREKNGTQTAIAGANASTYTTVTLTEDNANDLYFCRVYNDPYYNERGYVSSKKAKLILLEEANYVVERKDINTYLFERLQDAFDFAITGDVVKPRHAVPDETTATLANGKDIQLDLSGYQITLQGNIQIEPNAKLEIVGINNSAIRKNGEGYVLENQGELVLNGKFTINNEAGSGIHVATKALLRYLDGSMVVDHDAILAEESIVTIDGTSINIKANTKQTTGNAITLKGDTTFTMNNGTIEITTEVANGEIHGIYVDGKGSQIATITGGNIFARATNAKADGIANAGSSDIVIRGTTRVEGSRSGVANLSTNSYGDIMIEEGTIVGGKFGILNDAVYAKVVLGIKGDDAVSISAPEIAGEQAAVFNTHRRGTLEFYDGVLYSHGKNIIYENMENITLELDPTKEDLIYQEEGRRAIITEYDYSIFTERDVTYNHSTYHRAYLKQNTLPSISGPEDQNVREGERATFEVVPSGGHPSNYEFQWEVSTDGGKTWSKVTDGNGGTTSRYTTPPVTDGMDGRMYRCQVKNAKGTITSNEVTLTVFAADEVDSQRPVGRILFANGRIVEQENGEKVVNMKLIVKTNAELQSLKVNGKEIFGQDTFTFDDKSIIISKDADSPITLVRDDEVVEYTYTYSMKVYKNGIITVDMLDVAGRDNTVTQTVDLFFALKIDYSVSELTETSNAIILTFYANRPVKPIQSLTNSYTNGMYLDLVSLDGGEYSYRFNLRLKESLSETVFWFEDEVMNQASVTVDSILRVKYQMVKFFHSGVDRIANLSILEAYNLAQRLENVVEVNAKEVVQNRYGLNGTQADMFMSRARDIGAVTILGQATKASAYDGVVTSTIAKASGSHIAMYDYEPEIGNLFVAAAAKERIENTFMQQNPKYVDVFAKESKFYKGMKNLQTFRIDAVDAPYMYYNNNNADNIAGNTIATASFRVTIVGK